MDWGRRIATIGSRIAAICCDPLKPDFSKSRKKVVWIRIRRFSRLPIPVTREGWILVCTTWIIWGAWGFCIISQPAAWIMMTVFGMFAACLGLVAVFSDWEEKEEE